jgi:hypothetical protein
VKPPPPPPENKLEDFLSVSRTFQREREERRLRPFKSCYSNLILVLSAFVNRDSVNFLI